MVAENSIDDANGSAGMEDFVQQQQQGHFIYFSYGSNLLAERIHYKVKGAVFVSIGALSGYELVFFDYSKRWEGALASIEETADSMVWGCIWKVPNSFAAELDKQESGYHRLEVNILTSTPNGPRIMNCRTYQYSNEHRVLSPPSPHYKQVIVEGSIEHNLPTKYIKWLREIPTNGYCGEVELKLKALVNLNDQHDTDDDEGTETWRMN